MKGPSDIVVRKALLRAHAEIERYEIARELETLQANTTPRALLQQVLPGLVGSGGGAGSAWARAGSQLASLYRRYPLASSAVMGLLGRSRMSRIFQVAGVALAVVKAVGMARRGDRR